MAVPHPVNTGDFFFLIVSSCLVDIRTWEKKESSLKLSFKGTVDWPGRIYLSSPLSAKGTIFSFMRVQFGEE